MILQLHAGGLINKWFNDQFKPAIFMNNPDPVKVLNFGASDVRTHSLMADHMHLEVLFFNLPQNLFSVVRIPQ